MPMLRPVVLVLALLPVVSAVQGPARAQAPAQTPDGPVTHFGLTFPPEIGGAQRINVRAYEPGTPGAGYSAGYRHGEATSTVYIYDDGVASIPDNLDSAVVRDQFKQAKGAMGAAQAGISVREANTFTIHDAGKRARLICSAYVLVRQASPGAFDTFLCLGVYKGKFFKVRTTMPQRADAEAEVRRFIGLWIDRIANPSRDG